METVVLDTNVLLVSVSSRSPLHWIFQKLVQREYRLCISTEILAEYAEVIERHMGHKAVEAVLGTLANLTNVVQVTTYFRFNLLQNPDDNKFVDCAIASNANYIVSHDKDFKVLSNIAFPNVKVLDTNQFKQQLEIV